MIRMMKNISNSGKVYTMDVNKLLIIFIICFSHSCISSELSEGASSIEFVRLKAKSAAEKLEAVISVCNTKRQTSVTPIISLNILSQSGVDRKAVVQGLSYLSNRNFEICEGNSRMELAYQLGTLNSLADHYKLEISDIKIIQGALLYPTPQDIRLELVFKRLPQNIKKYLLKAVGSSPFDLIKTISSNNIFGK